MMYDISKPIHLLYKTFLGSCSISAMFLLATTPVGSGGKLQVGLVQLNNGISAIK